MADLVAAYRRDGFVHVPSVFTVGEMDELREDTAHLLAQKADTRPWSGSWRPEGAQYTLRTVPNMHDASPLWRALVKDARLVGLAQALIGPCALAATMLISKPPETGQPFPLHQDGLYYGDVRQDYCVLCLHLDATTPENGPLRVLVGQHTQGMLPHTGRGKRHLDPETYRAEDAVEVCAGSGDVVAFSLLTPHASTPNRSDRARVLARIGFRALV